MFEKISAFFEDLWTRIYFAFRPTYYVFSSLQDALAALPARGGTLRVTGTFMVEGKEGLTIPNKPLRLVGGSYLVDPGSSAITVPAGRSTKCVITGCSFIGVKPEEKS